MLERKIATIQRNVLRGGIASSEEVARKAIFKEKINNNFTYHTCFKSKSLFTIFSSLDVDTT